jgi:Na+/H+ antiporter NhaD/arsenite permease-like protein
MLLDRIRFEFEETGINKPVVYKGVGCLLLAIGMFVTQTITGLTPGTAALAAAMLLLIIARVDVEHTLLEVEWSTLLFFTGLFILVGVLEEEGVIRWIAENVFMRIGDNPYVIVLVVLWVSGLFSGFLDNIPFTVTMIPIIQHMLESTPIPHNILWWSLALGACFGGNFTYIGASANVVSVGMSEKNDVSISFIEFMRTGTPVTIISLLISSLYLSIYLYLSL